MLRNSRLRQKRLLLRASDLMKRMQQQCLLTTQAAEMLRAYESKIVLLTSNN